MDTNKSDEFVVGSNDPILITGAAGFVGSRLLEQLLNRGFRNIRCIVRPTSKISRIESLCNSKNGTPSVQIIRGNLLSKDDCVEATKDVALIYHLAAGTGDKSFPNAFMNSVVTTRNLLEASLQNRCLRRIVSISSFAVYTNSKKSQWRLLDESCPVEQHPVERGDAYCFAKIKQDEIIAEYGRNFGVPYVIVRPGYVYGPGKKSITGRVGTDTFGIFLHLGGSNKIPFTYIENCAEAIALAGLKKGIDGEIFNVVDDDLPSSRQFLRRYKKNVRRFNSIYVPHAISYALCFAWEWYSEWSEGQLPPTYNRKEWHAFWKKTNYSNAKLKARVGWSPRVPTNEGMQRFFEACRNGNANA